MWEQAKTNSLFDKKVIALATSCASTMTYFVVTFNQ